MTYCHYYILRCDVAFIHLILLKLVATFKIHNFSPHNVNIWFGVTSITFMHHIHYNAQMNSNMWVITALPREILQHIFAFIPASDLASNTSRVSKLFYEVLNYHVNISA